MQGIKLLHAPDESDNRFIIALTKQVKGSVKRNKVRRRIKAALAQLLKQHPLPAGIWICVAYESAITLTVANIHHFLRATLCDQNKTL
jgi:ribonuclease P protein component